MNGKNDLARAFKFFAFRQAMTSEAAYCIHQQPRLLAFVDSRPLHYPGYALICNPAPTPYLEKIRRN